jgi:hypothetical protein
MKVNQPTNKNFEKGVREVQKWYKAMKYEI